MNKQLAELAEHRQRLLEIIKAQRMEVIEISMHWQAPITAFDTGMKVVRFMHNNPGLLAGSLVALLSLRGTGVAGLARKGWRLLYLYPAAISIGLKYLLSTPRSTGVVDDSEVDH